MRMFLFLLCAGPLLAADHGFTISQTDDIITLQSGTLDAGIRKKGYVSGVMAGSLVDKKTGAHDLGFGLDIVDWIMEPGSDEAYRDKLPGDLPYLFDNKHHGKGQKRSIEGPQICTKARELTPKVIEGADFVAIEQSWNYTLAAPGKATGSEWRQKIVFPKGKRWFVSSDEIHAKNSSDAMFLRIDMPGHIKHKNGDTFSEVYLSYKGRIPASEFLADFAPDEKFNYRRDRDGVPTAHDPRVSRARSEDGQGWSVARGHDLESRGHFRGVVPSARIHLHDPGVRRASCEGGRKFQRGVHRGMVRFHRGDGAGL